jgi:serine O-acetyltransferase
VSAFGEFRSAVRADHEALVDGDARYGSRVPVRRPSLFGDLVRRIGFQMLFAYRVMRLFRRLGLTPLAMISSRVIRHLYAADIHWDAELAPGVAIVHGTALVISREARVGRGCILFQSVTLGVSIDPATRSVGGPTLEENVHVGPGAAVIGPVTIGHGSKIMANAVVMTSVPANSLVEIGAPTVRARSRVVPGQLSDGEHVTRDQGSSTSVDAE